MLVAAALGGLVILGMATGTDRHFDKGVADLGGVILVQVFGIFALLSLACVARACIGLWKGRRTRTVMWTAIAIVIWLFWALLRIGEYSS
jgi:hypothetical protein